MAVTTEALPDGSVVSTLAGVLPDQASLAAVLSALYDFGFALLSVEYVPAPQPGTPA